MADAIQRPKNVVIVDAEYPLVEVHREFYWREDHEAIVRAQREAAYRDGHEQGFSAAARSVMPAQQFVIRPRRRFMSRWLRRFAVAALALIFLSLLPGNILERLKLS